MCNGAREEEEGGEAEKLGQREWRLGLCRFGSEYTDQ
jgi:hypothetical protein